MERCHEGWGEHGVCVYHLCIISMPEFLMSKVGGCVGVGLLVGSVSVLPLVYRVFFVVLLACLSWLERVMRLCGVGGVGELS
jgi:hypothetical protein